jgi:hypothetical protein
MKFLLRLFRRKPLPPLDPATLRRGEWDFSIGGPP